MYECVHDIVCMYVCMYVCMCYECMYDIVCMYVCINMLLIYFIRGIIGTGISQFRSLTLKISFPIFARFRNPEDR